LKALVIRDCEGKLKDVGDVLAVARAEGKKIFKTRENVLVMRLFFERDIGWIAVVGCSGSQVECENREKLKNE
jgi:hydrogenase maturation factor